jgi:uncharacterized phiE125 gp8 family phage protein
MANLVRITEATGTVITIAELKAQLNFFENESDALLAGYIHAAQNWVSEAIGRPLLEETWEYRLNYFPCNWHHGSIRIPMPVTSITGITYLDSGGIEQELDTAVYLTIGNTISLAYGKHWPTTRREAGAVRVIFVSGFGPDHNSCPEPLREAVMLLAARFFAQRESILEQGWFESSLLNQLLLPYKARLVEAC